MDILSVTKTLLFALVFSLVGCAEGYQSTSESEIEAPVAVVATIPTFIFTIDSTMSLSDRVAIFDALNDWTSIAAVEGCFALRGEIGDVSRGGLTTVRTVDTKEDLKDCLPADAPSDSYVRGCATVSGIRLLRDQPFQRYTAAHEIGHMMGLDHDETEGSVMKAYLGANETPTSGPTLADASAACVGMHLQAP